MRVKLDTMKSKWTKDKISFLKENFNNLTYKELSKKLNICETSIRHKANSLGLKKTFNNAWNDQEKNFLIKNYGKLSRSQISRNLNKSKYSIDNQIKKLKLTNPNFNSWTYKQINFLKENINSLSTQEIANKTGKSKSSVLEKAKNLNLVKNSGNPWTKKEEEYLINNYKTSTYKEIGKKLGRTKKSIEDKARKLNIKKDKTLYLFQPGRISNSKGKKKWEISKEETRNKQLWLEEELSFLKHNFKTMSWGEIGYRLKRTKIAVKRKASDLNLKKSESSTFDKNSSPWNKGKTVRRADPSSKDFKKTKIPIVIDEKTNATIYISDPSKIKEIKEKYKNHINNFDKL